MPKLEARMTYHLDLSPEEFRLVTKALRICAEIVIPVAGNATIPEGFPAKEMQTKMNELQQYLFDTRQKQTDHFARQFAKPEEK